MGGPQDQPQVSPSLFSPMGAQAPMAPSPVCVVGMSLKEESKSFCPQRHPPDSMTAQAVETSRLLFGFV